MELKLIHLSDRGADMVKSVFIDYMGTIVDERSPEMAEIVRRICKDSNIHDPMVLCLGLGVLR